MAQKDKDNPQSSWLDSATAKWAGAIGAVAATWVMFRDAVSRAFFKTVNKDLGKHADNSLRPLHGAFTRLQDERDHGINSIIARFDAGEKLNVPEEINRISKDYDYKLAKRREALGFTGVLKEAQVLKGHQWKEVAFATGAVAIGAASAILAIASGRQKVHAQAETVDAKDAKIAELSERLREAESRTTGVGV